jgi:hypothetical protein
VISKADEKALWQAAVSAVESLAALLGRLCPAEQPAADLAGMTDAERDAVATRFAAGQQCPHCGGIHVRACPRVRRMAFRGEEIAEIEFWPPGQWPGTDVLFPEDFPPRDGTPG